ncbi:MAG TPA: ATP synthase F1 subunit epsilon [Alphaproteobacteria bacterium]|nr:ATP synthase F1 subunit epsilon [Alphaproteobacteria bacterium]
MIHFELVSPEKKLFSSGVAMVTLPGAEGDFGVLEGHAPLISSLRVGVIDIYENGAGTVSKRILVSGGLVEVRPDRCTALAEDATLLEEVNRDSMEAEIRRLREVLSIAQEGEKPALESQIELLNKKLHVLAESAAH